MRTLRMISTFGGKGRKGGRGRMGRNGRKGRKGKKGGKGRKVCHAANQWRADAFDVLFELVAKFLVDVAESIRRVNAVASFAQGALGDVEEMQTRSTGPPGKSFNDIRRH
jgi:hypothetical protein